MRARRNTRHQTIRRVGCLGGQGGFRTEHKPVDPRAFLEPVLALEPTTRTDARRSDGLAPSAASETIAKQGNSCSRHPMCSRSQTCPGARCSTSQVPPTRTRMSARPPFPACPSSRVCSKQVRSRFLKHTSAHNGAHARLRVTNPCRWRVRCRLTMSAGSTGANAHSDSKKNLRFAPTCSEDAHFARVDAPRSPALHIPDTIRESAEYEVERPKEVTQPTACAGAITKQRSFAERCKGMTTSIARSVTPYPSEQQPRQSQFNRRRLAPRSSADQTPDDRQP